MPRSSAPSTARVRSCVGRAREKLNGWSRIVVGDGTARFNAFIGIVGPAPERATSAGGIANDCISEDIELSGCCCS